MTDFKERIKMRAEGVGIELTEKQLDFLNEKVNKDIERGMHEWDALDYSYFYITDNFCEEL